MNKAVQIIGAAILLLQFSACEIQQPAEEEPADVDFTTTHGVQSNVTSQGFQVINDDDAYNQFWLTIESMSGAMPMYDESSETMVGITAHADACKYFPMVTAVTETDTKITVSVTNRQLVYWGVEGGCESMNPRFSYNIAKFAKTDKSIDVTFTGPEEPACDSPVAVYGNNDALLKAAGFIVGFKDGEDPEALANEYSNRYGEEFSLKRVLDISGAVSAYIAEAALADLRCDVRVETIRFNTPTTVL